MTSLNKISGKKTKTIIGLLSGTSVDAIDAVLMNISGIGKSTKLKVIDFITHPISPNIKLALLRNSDILTARIDEISQLNVIIGRLFAEAALKLVKKNKLKASQVDLIGSHGQTIHHLPEKKDYWGYRVKSTLQVGDPSVIANLMGVTTVGDFRIADCAVDGDGAPLAPYLDYILFTHKTKNRGLLNIGGIANITLLKKNARKQDVIAFDSGPGNMLIDGMMYHLFKRPYDKNGAIAKKGIVNPVLFNWLLSDDMYQLRPPKSTGREHYGKDFQKKLLKIAKGMKKNDVIRTVTEFTAYSICYNYKNFLASSAKLDELIVSGGGVDNPVLMKSLTSYFKGTKVRKMNDFGITYANKEAVLFAILANECLSGNSANMPSVSGGKKDVILGKICQA